MILRLFTCTAILLFLFGCDDGQLKKADRLFEAGEYELAISAYTHFIENRGKKPGAFYNRGRAYEELNRLTLAEEDFLTVLKLEEKNVNAMLSLSKLFYEQKKYSRALVYSQKALDINENSADGHFLTARSLHQLGNINGAMEAYTLAIKINQNYGEAYLYRGALKVHSNKVQSACEDFKKAENLEVEDASSIIKTYCK